MQSPTVQHIVIAPASRLPVRSVRSVVVEAGKGLVGDRYHGTKHRRVVRPAAPCRLMDEEIGDGARRALSGRAGAIFRALTSGTINVGDPVDLDAGTA